MTVAAILVAGGRGTRMGGDLPKQFLPLGQSTVLAQSVAAFLAVPGIGHVQVVIGEEDEARYAAALSVITDARLLPPVTGGATRGASVVAGLDALRDIRPDKVLVHDAARPFCPAHVIDGVIDALDGADGAFAALPLVDALWRAEDGHAMDPVPREGLWRAQTPQGFRYDKIRAAYAQAPDLGAADDVAVARAAGLTVKIVPGDPANFKVTTQDDLARAQTIARQMEGEDG